MKKTVSNFTVIENTPLNLTNFFIRLEAPEPLPKIIPGQFLNIEIDGVKDVFLRRPFSFFDVDYTENTVSILVKILGKGSKKLSELHVGEQLSIVFPLGKGFSLPCKNDKILLVGGGSGIAPLLFLAKSVGLAASDVQILIGARSINDHIPVDRYHNFGNFNFATEDGTLGFKGLVTQHPLFSKKLNDFDKIYTCGPNPMMKAVAKEATIKGIFCEVSLENLMACGFGVCLCCIEPTNKGNLCVCTEGPVFNINSLKW